MKTESPYAKIDCDGSALQAGDEVLILGVPDLSGMSAECRAESQPVFEHLKGKKKRILAFDEYGHAEIEFRFPENAKSVGHTVWLEPYLLKKQ
jgi:hypothetical protein